MNMLVRLEPATFCIRVSRATDWANESVVKVHIISDFILRNTICYMISFQMSKVQHVAWIGDSFKVFE